MACLYPRTFRGGKVGRCGSCKSCVGVKLWVNSARIMCEMVPAARTWFVTLTFKNEPASDKAGYDEVTKWIKRLRKAGLAVRYAAIAERGSAGGRLHYHLVLHTSADVTKRRLLSWPGGFFRFRLASGKKRVNLPQGHRALARYLAKYVTKQGGRWRFSQGYGKHGLDRIKERPLVAEALEVFAGSRVVSVGGIKLPRRLSGAKPELVFDRSPDELDDLEQCRRDYLRSQGRWVEYGPKPEQLWFPFPQLDWS